MKESSEFLGVFSFYPKLLTQKESEVAQLCPTLCDPVDCSPPGSSVHGILQARILKWVAISFFRGSSRLRDQTQVSHVAGRRFILWATREGLANADCMWLSVKGHQSTHRWAAFCKEGHQSWSFSSVQFSHSVVSDSATPWVAARQASCPSPTLRVHSNSHPSSWWCHPAISSSVIPFSSCPQSLPASESFPMSQFFAWGGQSTGVSALASFLPKNTQDWSPLESTGLDSSFLP